VCVRVCVCVCVLVISVLFCAVLVAGPFVSFIATTFNWKDLPEYINNCPTRCNTKQSIYYSASSLYMFRVSTTPIIRNTQNCNYSLRYWSYFLCSYLPPTWPRWREVAARTGGYSYSFVYSWWWVWLQPGHYSSLTARNLQPTANQERNDQCGNQQHSREFLMMSIVMPETCWGYKKYNKITSGI